MQMPQQEDYPLYSSLKANLKGTKPSFQNTDKWQAGTFLAYPVGG